MEPVMKSATLATVRAREEIRRSQVNLALSECGKQRQHVEIDPERHDRIHHHPADWFAAEEVPAHDLNEDSYSEDKENHAAKARRKPLGL